MDARKPYAICTCGFVDVRKPYAICTSAVVVVGKPYAICPCALVDVRKPYAISTSRFVDVRKLYAICACGFVDVGTGAFGNLLIRQGDRAIFLTPHQCFEGSRSKRLSLLDWKQGFA